MAGEATATSVLTEFLDVSVEDYEISEPLPFSSIEAVKDEDPESENEDRTAFSKSLKPGKKNQKGPKIIIHTKSEEDKLDDGYKWRKYGRRAVKNSTFVRNYYRCTTPDCGVRRMIERSVSDPETVVTTYVGIHTHAVPVESAAVNHHNTGGASSGSLSAGVFQAQQQQGFSDVPPVLAPYYEQQQQEEEGFFQAPTSMMMPLGLDAASSSASASSSFSFDQMSGTGLLEDMLPSHLRRKDI